MPKIVLPENIKNLKSQLELANNLIDYFLVCGVSPNICREKYLYDITNQKYLENLSKKLKPTILSKFPEFDLSIDTIDEEIINYCFPKGFTPVSSYNGISPKIFSIILDNNLFSADHPQKYLVCLLFYEKVSEYKRLQLNIENRKATPSDYLDDDRETVGMTLDRRESGISISSFEPTDNRQTMDNSTSTQTPMTDIYGKKELQRCNNIQSKGGKLKYFYIPKCISIVSIYPYIKLFEKILLSIYQYSQGTHEIPIEKLITNLIIEVPIPPRGLYSINYLLIDDLYTLINFENNRLPVAEINFKTFNRVLSFETIIEGLKHILLCSKLLIFGSDLNLICETILGFLYLLFPFKYPFQVASFLHKDSYRILESVSPFILGINEPYSDTFFIDNDITIDGMNIFIINLDKKTSESLLYETFPEFPKKMLDSLEKEIKTLEVKFKRDKFKEMGGRNSVSSYNSCNPRISNTTDGGYSSLKDFNENYQYYFFYFFCEILRGYEKSLNMDYFNSNDSDKVTSIDTLFNCKKFIEYHHSYDKPFYTKFVEDSQLFADFITKRMIPRNNQEIIDVLLVNETIIKIKNRNKLLGGHKTEFLDSTQYKIVGKYVVPKPREITKEEKKYLLSRIFDYKKKGQIITKEKKLINKEDKKEEKEIDLTKLNLTPKNSQEINSPNKSNNNFLDIMKKNINKHSKINQSNKSTPGQQKPEDSNFLEELSFQYYVFPELDFKLYCNNDNVNEYYPPPDYSDEIEAVNTILISKSSLGQNINRNLEMRNYIYLTWLEIWSFTFWYIDKNERQYRFNQMLDILDKVIHHEMNIFNLMFDILNQQNEQILIYKLYQKLLQLKINPSTFIYNIISNILDKDQIKELIEESKININSNKSLKFEINNNVISQFKERTFLSKSDKLLISSKLKFDIFFPCVNCGEKINLYNICQNYDNAKNDILWAPCPNKECGEYNLPKINVKFGFELFPSLQTTDKKKKNISTCTTNEIVLHCPYNLKINIKNAVTTHYGNKLDLNSFKNNFNPLFWDFIWYCHIHNLDYSIILPYLDNIEQMNEKSYKDPNNDIMQITLNNQLYKRNENLIYDTRANKNTINKKENLVKKFKILIEKNEQSIEIEKIKKDLNKKEVSVFMDHLNKVQVGFKMPINNNINIKKEKVKGISSQLMRVPTRRKNIDFDIKFPEISMENVKKNNDLKNNLPVPIDDKNKDANKKRVGIAFYKKNK